MFVNIPKKIKRIDIRISFTSSTVIFSARKIWSRVKLLLLNSTQFRLRQQEFSLESGVLKLLWKAQ